MFESEDNEILLYNSDYHSQINLIINSFYSSHICVRCYKLFENILTRKQNSSFFPLHSICLTKGFLNIVVFIKREHE
jgi:hypothetical protein